MSVKTYCTQAGATALTSEIGCVWIYDCLVLLHFTQEKLETILERCTDKNEELASLVEMQSIIQGAFSAWFKPAIRWRLWAAGLNSQATAVAGATSAGTTAINVGVVGLHVSLTPNSTVRLPHYRPCTESIDILIVWQQTKEATNDANSTPIIFVG